MCLHVSALCVLIYKHICISTIKCMYIYMCVGKSHIKQLYVAHITIFEVKYVCAYVQYKGARI